MVLEYVLLGLLLLHPNATGYELNRIINTRIENFMSIALSHIYPTLQKLYKKAYVTYQAEPIKNRLSKKRYQVTQTGEQVFQTWLREPIESKLDMNAFFLKMSFSLLMDKQTIIAHINREIVYREEFERRKEIDISNELNFLDQDLINIQRTEMLWQELAHINHQIENLRLKWLKEWQQSIDMNLKE